MIGPAKRSSPVCYAETDAVDMRYAGWDEILVTPNELLKAERAGARLALLCLLELDDVTQAVLIAW